MENVTLENSEKDMQAFVIKEGREKSGEMLMGVSGNKMTVYHTEVAPAVAGKGLAKRLLDAMAAYARQHQLKVIPLCSFVQAQFKRHPEIYADIIEKEKT